MGNVDPIFFKSLSSKPRDYFSKDSFQEVYEVKAQKREQSILKAAQSLLQMSVNKSYDLTGGKIEPYKGFSELLT